MEIKKKLVMLEEIMDLDEDTLTLETVLENVEEWDSLSALSLTVTMKREFGVELTTETIRSFVTVKDICDLMEK